MEPLGWVEAWYYSTFYYCVMLVISWVTVIYYIGSNGQKILYSEGSPMQSVALLLTLFWAFFMGLRPMSGMFGDMTMYAHSYNNVIHSLAPVSMKTEWLWIDLNYFCKSIGYNVHEFFLVVSMFYYMGMFFCCLLLLRKNLWIGILFFFTAFSNYSFGTNGIRNGLGCSIELVAISLLAQGGAKRPMSFVLMFLAMGVHRSTMLPTAAVIASTYAIRDTKWAIRFWIASIAISLAAGPLVEQFFAGLGFDDRMDKYSSANQDEKSMGQFSGSGFRWDFLFYSMFPVIMVWYVTRYRRFTDRTYMIIANTYLLCNAFWVMVIRSAFSNRFAYLSWFIYPLVMAYPLLRMNIWKDQDRKTALIFFLYSAFTFFMFFIYYFSTINGFNGFNQYWWRY